MRSAEKLRVPPTPSGALPTDPQSNAFSILFNGSRDDATMSDLDADTWFDVPGADRIEIGEQSFRVHDDLVMALLVARSERMLAD